MPKVIDNKTYICNICGKPYPLADLARKCESGHDIVLVPIEREDLKRLVLFINTGEQKLLTPSLLQLLRKYSSLKAE